MAQPTCLLLNGPNLAMLGTREPEKYGSATLADLVELARAAADEVGIALDHFQTDSESDMVKAIHGAVGGVDAIVINPGAFTHYAWAIHDALAMFAGPVIELHMTNTAARESWRHMSVVTPVADALIAGLGAEGYPLAVRAAARLCRDGAQVALTSSDP